MYIQLAPYVPMMFYWYPTMPTWYLARVVDACRSTMRAGRISALPLKDLGLNVHGMCTREGPLLNFRVEKPWFDARDHLMYTTILGRNVAELDTVARRAQLGL